jgi:hypothetical protein
MKPSHGRRRSAPRLVARFVAISWRDLAITFGPICLVSVFAIWLAIRLIQPAPPNTLTITAGPVGGMFWNAAQKYKTILKHNGVTLNVLTSQGSLQNLERLANSATHADVGFVQSGTSMADTKGHVLGNIKNLISLGSVSYVPLVVFYTGPQEILLSDFFGKKIAIGPQGSGTRQIALALLKANGIVPGGPTMLLSLTGDDIAKALLSREIDVAFLTGDSAQPPVMAALARTPGIRQYNFVQADAYVRRFPYLKHIDLPMGAFDLGKNLPATTIHIIAPTAELIARNSLHPALSDLLIEAAREVHGGANLLQHAGEFPQPLAHDFPLSDDAARYYKSGKSFLYSTLPFWLASLADRMIVLLVPIIVVLIPGLKLVPSLYVWRVKSRTYRWYGALIAIERGMMAEPSEAERATLIEKLDVIEESVNKLKVPLAYAEQFYVLRQHIGFVRARLLAHYGHEPMSGVQPH